MAPADFQTLAYLWYRVSDLSYYLKRLEGNMRSRPTWWPTYVEENHFLLRVQVWRAIRRFDRILDPYAVRFTSGLKNHRLWLGGQYPLWDFCTCFERGDVVCLWS